MVKLLAPVNEAHALAPARDIAIARVSEFRQCALFIPRCAHNGTGDRTRRYRPVCYCCTMEVGIEALVARQAISVVCTMNDKVGKLKSAAAASACFISDCYTIFCVMNDV